MTKKKDSEKTETRKSAKTEFKKAKTKKKKPAAKKEQPYHGGGSFCSFPSGRRPTPGWIKREQW